MQTTALNSPTQLCTTCAEECRPFSNSLTKQHLCSGIPRPTVTSLLQKEATGSLPRFSLDFNILRQYFRSRRWLAGLAADFGGALLMIGAFALAPVSLVQPVSGVGLVSLAVYSHVWLKARGPWLAKRFGARRRRTLGSVTATVCACGGLT